MTETIKILAQAQSSGGTYVTGYTVSSTSAIISTITICDADTINDNVNVYTVKSGQTQSTSNTLYYNLPVYSGDTFASTIGITLATGDSVVLYAALSSNIAIQLFGSEIT